MALKHRPIMIYIEDTAAGQVFVPYLKTIARDKGVNLPVQFIKVDVNKHAKHTRISLCSGYLKQKKLFFFAGLPCWERLFNQFTKYPGIKHDDYPDTVALMCNHYHAWSPLPKVQTLASYILSQSSPLTDHILNEHKPDSDPLGEWLVG